MQELDCAMEHSYKIAMNNFEALKVLIFFEKLMHYFNWTKLLAAAC